MSSEAPVKSLSTKQKHEEGIVKTYFGTSAKPKAEESVIYGISVYGQSLHSGLQFGNGIAKLINCRPENSHGKNIVLVDDGLQRFCQAIISNQPPSVFLDASVSLGNAWYNAHKDYIDHENAEIVRYSNVIKSDSFKNIHSKIIAQIKADEEFKKAF